MFSLNQRFLLASRSGVEPIEALLRDHPGLNVNCRAGGEGWTALHTASSRGNFAVVKFLLAQPGIDVNSQSLRGQVPLEIACRGNKVSVVELLVKDPSVNAAFAKPDRRTSLWYASLLGHVEVIEWLLASGRDLGDLDEEGIWFGQGFTPLEVAKKENKVEAVSLLEKFLINPQQTRHELRVKLCFLAELVAAVFALMVFLCDDLLEIKPAFKAATATVPVGNVDAARFLTIASKLSMELQMTLCHRSLGSMKQNIRSTDSEAAFKSLCRILLLAQSKSK